MFSDESTVIPSDNKPEYDDGGINKKSKLKKIALIVALAVAVVVFVLAIIVVVNRLNESNIDPIDNNITDNEDEDTNNQGQLPDPNQEGGNGATTTDPMNGNDFQVEYLSFTDFYDEPSSDIETNINDYQLPINIKIEGMNYYDLSRKINLDPVIDDLNNNGFATLDNPWKNEAPDFYGIYKQLEEKQVPLFISSDFLIYYYQNNLKQIFKGIEESVFYDNLWSINKELYEIAKNRYETRLASIGSINDAILEGQRMEMAFFAVSLELLKPASDQIAAKGAIEDRTKFSKGDVEKFYFNAPPYIKEDVLREVRLIRQGKELAKSPNLLYMRDYNEFSVPREYKGDAKLNNFYLAAKWLNSNFPINYKSDYCPECYLDQEDWRLSMIAASLISSDFSSKTDLKSDWAMIYKLMAFFQGLREEIDYVDFRDSLINVFGEDYKVEELFNDRNPEAMANLEKLKNDLLTYNFPKIRGALDKDDPKNRKLIGFKMLTGPYWPNDYIFDRLTHPAVTKYQGEDYRPQNLTACELNKQVVRCNGFSMDIVNLIYPMDSNSVFQENTNYINYDREASILIEQLNRDGLWHTSNYWSTVSLMESVVEENNELPIFTKSDNWQNKNINTAISAWINLQLPLDEFALTPIFDGSTLGDFSNYGENIYVEPNLSLVDELIATNDMLAEAFSILGLNRETNVASQIVNTMDDDLNMVRDVVVKELTGEALTEKDGEKLMDFAKKYRIENYSDADKVLRLDFPEANITISQSLEDLKLIAVVYKSGKNKVIAVGPIWNYRETR